MSAPLIQRDIRRLLIANRGEIALRIIRACQALGVETVLACSEADADSLPAREADRQVVIGPPPAAESYLNIPALVAAGEAEACDAVHPGYGFLAENAAFARAVEKAGMVFVGPRAETIAQMGDKIAAAAMAEAAGVPRVPGSGKLADAQAAQAAADQIGYPVMVKAAAGGGGRGMRIVTGPEDMASAFASAANEAESAFGDPTLFVEKYIPRARHVEIQVMADDHGHVVHLGERDCSTQRRHQKLIEEAPSPLITETMRAEMGAAAVALALQADYRGAGTVEFVVDADSKAFYFLEMNTRIQVEHPVTEMVTGIDLVAEQIRVAMGLPLSFSQEAVGLEGHAIECRINAEDPDKGFLPRPGVVTVWEPPEGEGIRLDSHMTVGAEVTPYYDSLIGKLIVHGRDRQEAIARMRAALAQFRVGGIATTIPFHAAMMAHEDFLENRITTTWVENVLLPAQTAARKAARKAARAKRQGAAQ